MVVPKICVQVISLWRLGNMLSARHALLHFGKLKNLPLLRAVNGICNFGAVVSVLKFQFLNKPRSRVSSDIAKNLMQKTAPKSSSFSRSYVAICPNVPCILVENGSKKIKTNPIYGSHARGIPGTVCTAPNSWRAFFVLLSKGGILVSATQTTHASRRPWKPSLLVTRRPLSLSPSEP